MVTTSSIAAPMPLYTYETRGIGLMRSLRAAMSVDKTRKSNGLVSEPFFIQTHLCIANDDEMPWLDERLYSTRGQLRRWKNFFESVSIPGEEPSISDLGPPFECLRPGAQFQWALRAITFARFSFQSKLKWYFAEHLLPELESADVCLQLYQKSSAIEISGIFKSLSVVQQASLYAMLLLDESRPYGCALRRIALRPRNARDRESYERCPE